MYSFLASAELVGPLGLEPRFPANQAGALAAGLRACMESGVGVEPTVSGFADRCQDHPSLPLVNGRSERIRTFDLVVPNHALLNQTELHSEMVPLVGFEPTLYDV